MGDPTPYDFLNPHLFIEFLRSADEIITYNGRKCDFIVLEHAVSKDAIAEIWAKTHHDLSGWPGNRYGLRLAVSAFQPDFVANYDRILNDREVALVSAGVEPQFTASRLADTFRDALALSHLWAAYESSGDNSFTFRDAARGA